MSNAHPRDSHQPSRLPQRNLLPSSGKAGSLDLQNAEATSAIGVILEQLKQESGYLDSVISFCHEMKTLLLQRSSSSPSSESGRVESAHGSTELSAVPSESQSSTVPPAQRLAEMQDELARQFIPIDAGRQAMKASLARLHHLTQSPPTIRSLAPLVSEPVRQELKQLRHDICNKLNDVRAIMLGNQAILVYTLDFYQRLVTGLTGETAPTQAYNANGQVTNAMGSGMLRKNC